jgi:hypothetical protein
MMISIPHAHTGPPPEFRCCYSVHSAAVTKKQSETRAYGGRGNCSLAAAQCRVLPARPLSLGLNFYTNTARPERNAQNRWIISCEVLLIVLLCWCVESKRASAHKTFENGLFNKHSSTDLRRVCVTQERGAGSTWPFQSRSVC